MYAKRETDVTTNMETRNVKEWTTDSEKRQVGKSKNNEGLLDPI